MLLKVVVLATTMACAVTLGQGNRRNSRILPSQGGSVEISVGPLDEISSLEGLAVESDLIVQASVERSLPSRFRDTSFPDSIETDSLVAIRDVLFGEDQSTNGRILISQMGGRIGDFEALVPQDTLLREGREYFLFLTRDPRDLPNSTGAPRYVITGVWKGKVPIEKESGKAVFSLSADDAPNRNASLKRFEISEIRARVQNIASARDQTAPPK